MNGICKKCERYSYCKYKFHRSLHAKCNHYLIYSKTILESYLRTWISSGRVKQNNEGKKYTLLPIV